MHSCPQYYGPYGDISPDSNSAPKPNVNVDIVPGCNILRNQFAVANYSGPLPCTLPGQGAPAPSAAAGGRRLMQAAFQSSNTSAECVVRPLVSSQQHHYLKAVRCCPGWAQLNKQPLPCMLPWQSASALSYQLAKAHHVCSCDPY